MFELPLDIPQKGRGAKAKQIRLHPAPTQFIPKEREIEKRILGFADPPGRLVADAVAGDGVIGADSPNHRQRYRQRSIHAFLAGRCLDEIRPRHHADKRGPRDIAQRPQLTRCKDRLDMGLPAGVTKGLHFLIKRLPVSGQHMSARDDDINLRGTGLDAFLDLGNAQMQGGKARRKSC